MKTWVKRYRVIFGGNWNNGAKCGSRYAKFNNAPLNLNSNISGQGASDTVELTINSLLAGCFTLLRYV